MEDKELREILKLLQRLRGSTTEESTQLQREDLETAAKSIQAHYEAKIVDAETRGYGRGCLETLAMVDEKLGTNMASKASTHLNELKKEKH